MRARVSKPNVSTVAERFSRSENAGVWNDFSLAKIVEDCRVSEMRRTNQPKQVQTTAVVRTPIEVA